MRKEGRIQKAGQDVRVFFFQGEMLGHRSEECCFVQEDKTVEVRKRVFGNKDSVQDVR